MKDIIGRSVKQSSVKTDLILYNDKAHVIEFTADNYEKVIADLKAGGMTSFNAAFTKVNRVITEAGMLLWILSFSLCWFKLYFICII